MITSCIILNYNDAKNCIRLFENIKHYSLINYIIIVDNCSTDSSYADLKNIENESTIIMQTNKNGGYGYGNNSGILYASQVLHSDYILIANPDVEFSDRTVLAMTQMMLEDEHCAAVSIIVLDVAGKKQVSAWKLPSAAGYILSASTILNKIFGYMKYPADYFDSKNACDVDIIPGSLLLINTDAMIQYGMYDEDIFLYCEETALGMKLKSGGYTSKLLLDHSYIHRHSESIDKTLPSSKDKRILFLRSRLIILKKYYGICGLRYILAKVFLRITLFEYLFISLLIGTKNSVRNYNCDFKKHRIS